MTKKIVLLLLILICGSGTVFGQNTTRSGVNPATEQVVQNVAAANPISQPVADIYPEIVAEVNGDKITRDDLIHETLRMHGEEVLQRILHRALILAECRRRNITITRDDVDKEIAHLARSINLDKEQYLQFIQSESNMTPMQYAQEVVWPKLALETLAAEKIQVNEEELQRKYLSKYGPSLGLQMILTDSKEKADEIHVQVTNNPETFGDIAKMESLDVLTASNKGRMQPVFRYNLPDPQLEEMLFALEAGEISAVIGPYGPSNDYLLFKCENKYNSIVPEDKVVQLKERIRQEASADKLKAQAALLFESLGREAKVENILANPQLRQQYPNLAATIDGQPIYLASVVEMALRLYGRSDLETLISLKLIQQECKKVQLTVTPQDIDTEIWMRAAEVSFPLPDGSPNIKQYLKDELDTYGVSEKGYRESMIWPSVAVKKLSAGLVKITEEDIQKSFDANFGQSVQCLAIVMKDERKAREVWQKARTIPQRENRPLEEVFGELAAEFSAEPGSRQMRGKIPPIIQNGGYPQVEKEAFALKPGELSSIVQVDRETFIILYCQEIIPAKEITLAEARESVMEDLQRKKEALAVEEFFTGIIRKSTIVNNLTSNTTAPEKETTAPQPTAPATPPAPVSETKR